MSIEWQDAYKVGYADIDAQHQHLFDLTNDLMAAEDLPTLRWLIMQLYKHTREHFELEEGLMRKLNYPGASAHTGYHDSLLIRLNALSQQVGQGEFNKPVVEKLMTDWALRHIPNDDSVFANFMATLRYV
jgi:hemerythrin